ncbi:glycosyltransferase family 4 protein [Sphingobacterium suaedae]|uniref:Glycosyltransferase family 4 protein n=1 Tax=Sphingobacterium suaedae TaxID=1686402 RepID=A0ABW5KLT7_9SPHI
MKIVYCIAATHNSGGMERVLTNKANELVRRGYTVVIVTTDQNGKPAYFDVDPRIHCYDLDINYVDEQGKGPITKTLNYLRKQRLHRKKLTALLTKLQPDVVVSMFDHDVSFLYKVQEGSKKVLEIHFSRFKRIQYNRTGIWRMIDRWRSRQDVSLAKKYDRFVVLTEEDKGYWGALPNMLVIPNANSFESLGDAPLTAKRVIAVGRYDYQKGFDELIQVWHLVHACHPDWRLDIFGKGPLQEKLQRQIEALGLGETVSLRAPVQHIEQEYMASSILAMTSRYEGLPMTLLEAQACGLPLVAYACKCGPRDIIVDGKNGYLLMEYDRQGMANRLMEIMENDDLRAHMGKASREKSILFSKDRVMQQWIQLFEELNQQMGRHDHE